MERKHPISRATTPRSNNLRERLLDFSVLIIQGLEALRHHPEGRFLVGQLFRSATAIGANYEEAQAAESRADFVHKMQVALKEARETAYWLRLSHRIKWFEDAWRESALQEAEELTRILAKSVVTAKSNAKAPPTRLTTVRVPVPPLSFLVFTFAFCLLPFAL